MARVMGPTPPGTGVMYDAFSATAAKSTSPQSLPLCVAVHGHVDDHGALLHHIGGDQARPAHGGHQDVRLGG